MLKVSARDILDAMDGNPAEVAARAIRDLSRVAPWALDNSARHIARGNHPPEPKGKRVYQAWESNTAHLLAFVEDRIELDVIKASGCQGYAWTEPGDLYEAYIAWCKPSDMLHRVRDPLAPIPFWREIKQIITRAKVNEGYARGVMRYRCRIIGWDDEPPGA